MKGRRKKLTALFLCVVFIAALTACAGKNEGAAHSEEPAVQSEADAETSNSETSETGNGQEPFLSEEDKADENTEETEAEVSDSNILIAYFTWAENTHVENPEAVDVDATTSASVLPPGNTAKMADWIRERTGGDLFSIVVTEPYSDDYDECLDRAADEKAENARPELVNHVENMQEYDVIFLGFPNWWYTAPMAIFSFIEEYDFSGRTIIPFCAHGTGGLASSVKDITDALPDSAEVLEPIGVYRPDVDSAQPVINEWLDSLGYTEGSMSETILVEKVEGNETVKADERMGSAVESNTENAIEKREYRDVVYDTLSEVQKFDLYLPETGEGPFPFVMFIHGGGWFSGDKTDGQERAWVTLREQGYAVASINYRLSGEAPHPAGIIDCKTALRYLKAHADEYHIDAERVTVSGDSSGGHYALMVALTAGNPDFEDLTRGNPEQASDVACAVVWYPATDLAETMRTVWDGEYTGFGADFAWSNIERYAGKKIEDVNDDVLVSASPVQYVAEDMPPVLLQHGNADTICPIDQSRRIYQRMIETAGEDRAEFDILDGAEHGDADFETVENMERIVQFLKQCGL